MSSARSSDRTLRIAVIGGGIGGLFAALCLRHHCQADKALELHIDIYEQASEFREIGAGVGLGVNAARLFHKIGLGDRLNSVAGYRNGIWISFRRFDNSDEIVTVPLNDEQSVRQAPIARSALLDLLREAIEEQNAATLHTKKHCLRVEDHDKEVKIYFADSTTVTADLVVAADGIHSNVRNQFVHDKPNYAGQIAYRAVVPTSQLSHWPFPTYSVAWVAKHRHMLVFPISKNESLNIVAFVTVKEEEVRDVEESWSSVCDRSDIERDFAGFDKTVQQIISLMPERPSKWRLNDRDPLDEWSFFGGKVMLLGDSAHAMLPHMGAGAGQAIEDGWVLGRTIGEYMGQTDPEHIASLADCASHYQAVRKQRAQKVQRSSRAAGDTYEMQTDSMLEKSYDECIPIMAEVTRNRMQFLWEESLDEAYDKVKVNGSQ